MPAKNKYIRLLGDIGIFTLGSLGSKVILFLLLPIYTNVLSEAEYGIADLVFSISELILPVISIAIYNGLLRYGLIEGKRENALYVSTMLFVIGSLLIVVLSPLIRLYRPVGPWIGYLTLCVIVSFARANTLVYLKVKDKNLAYSILSIVQALLLVAFNVTLLIIMKWGIKGYLLSTIISNAVISIVACVVGGIISDLKTAYLDRQLLKEMVVYSFPFVINDISWWLINSSDKIMIEWMIGSTLLGIYTAASKIPSLINAFTAIFTQAWGLASAREFDSSNESTFYSTVFKYYCDILFGITLAVNCLIRPFMDIYVGSSFAESWHYVPPLIVAATFAAISTFAVGLYSASKQSKSIMTTSIVSGLTNLGLNFVLIKRIGLWGAVIATLVAYAVLAALRLAGTKKVISIQYDTSKLVALSVMCIAEALLIGASIGSVAVGVLSLALYVWVIRDDVKPIYQLVQDFIVRN